MLPAPSALAQWRDLLYGAYGRPNQYVSWLEPVWYGAPDIARVVLHQVVPAGATNALVWAPDQRLAVGPGPQRPDPRFRVLVNPKLLSREQWTVYERFGCYSQPFWIVEGNHGGHKRRFNDVESRLLTAIGHSGTAPIAGSMPYVPVDQRTLHALYPLDEMRMWAKATELYARTPDDFDRDERDAMERGQRKLTAWLAEQVAWAFDDVITYKHPLDLPKVGGDMPDLDALDAAIHQAA